MYSSNWIDMSGNESNCAFVHYIFLMVVVLAAAAKFTPYWDAKCFSNLSKSSVGIIT